MLYLGLSGGIGSGKSTVSARLAELGAVVIDADALARAVVDRGSDGLAEVATRFGDAVLLPNGSLNRPALGAIVFADETARRDLEAITHPRIRELTAQRQAKAPRDAIVVHDMPLLVEGGLAPDYHLTLIVDAAEEVRVERIMRDRGMSHSDARARVLAQATDEQRYAVADVLLDNNGTRQQLLDQVETLWRERFSPYNENLLAGRAVSRPSLVEIAEPDPEWPVRAGRMIARIRRHVEASAASAGLMGVDHIGSTAVPGLTAKDVIDLRVRLADLAVAEDAPFVSAMQSAGFVPTSGRRRAVDGVNPDTVHPRPPEPGQRRKLTFGGCDPAHVVHVQVHHDDGREVTK